MFEKPAHKTPFEQAAQQRRQVEEKIATLQQEQADQNGQSGQAQPVFAGQAEELQKQGRTITVVGVTPDPHRSGAYIIAGTYQRKNDGKIEPAAVCVDDHTLVLNAQGEQLAPLLVESLQTGEQISVEGKKSKRAVIDADCILVPTRQ